VKQKVLIVRRFYRLLMIAFALSIVPCRAELGETMDQCIARYGQPVPQDTTPPGLPGKSVTFKKNGYVIMVAFLKGIAGFETIFKEDESELSDKEIEAILQADVAGGKWGKPEQLNLPHAKEMWSRDDGATAVYEPMKHGLVLVSKQYADATQTSTDK
jgi:hypothetical protein